MIAALAVKDAGKDPLILEKTDKVGGSIVTQVITAVMAQGLTGIHSQMPIPEGHVRAQLDAGSKFRLDLDATEGNATRAPLLHPEIFAALKDRGTALGEAKAAGRAAVAGAAAEPGGF